MPRKKEIPKTPRFNEVVGTIKTCLKSPARRILGIREILGKLLLEYSITTLLKIDTTRAS